MAAVTVRPLEVVDERPVEVAVTSTPRAGAVDGVEVRAQERRAPDVAPVGNAVLADEEGPAAVRVAEEQAGEPLGVDLPTEVVARAIGDGGGLVRRSATQMAHDEVARVVVHAQVVEAAAERRERLVDVDHLGQHHPDAAERHRVEERLVVEPVGGARHDAVRRVGRVRIEKAQVLGEPDAGRAAVAVGVGAIARAQRGGHEPVGAHERGQRQRARRGSRTPGGHWAARYPFATSTLGSLMVHHQSTRSPNAAPARPANAASAAGAPSQSQPPRADTQVGRVKW